MTDLPIHVFANISNEDNLIPVKRFKTFEEARAWIAVQEKERPGYYEAIHEIEFDTSA